jgi:hypothetical protein
MPSVLVVTFGPAAFHSHPRYSRPFGMLLFSDRGSPDVLGGNTPRIISDRPHRHAEHASPMT